MELINKLQAIGNAIREKSGTSDLLTLDDMAEQIKNMESSANIEIVTSYDANSSNIVTKLENNYKQLFIILSACAGDEDEQAYVTCTATFKVSEIVNKNQKYGGRKMALAIYKGENVKSGDEVTTLSWWGGHGVIIGIN